MAAAKQHTNWVGRADEKSAKATDPTNPFYDERLQGLADQAKAAGQAKMATTPSGPGGTSTRLAKWVAASRKDKSRLESYWRGVDGRAAKAAADARADEEARRKKIKEQIADIRGTNGK